MPRCTLPVYFPGLVVTVTDAQSGAPVENAVVTITDGNRTETLFGSGGEYSGGGTGTWTLTVAAAGFETETITDLVVPSTPDGCNAETQYIEAGLTSTGG
jgi:hypothetical protein